jgi:hypothetical protein
MRLEYALKRLESAAHKILREGVLAADLPPYNTALRDQALDGAVPGAAGYRNPAVQNARVAEMHDDVLPPERRS